MIAREGCVKRLVSGPATWPYEIIFAKGSTPWLSAKVLDTTTIAEPPSEIWLALPAVIFPLSANAGRSFARPAASVPDLTPSSTSNEIGSPFRCGINTGTISSLNVPAEIAATARDENQLQAHLEYLYQ